MSRFLPQVRKTYDFEGDKVSVSFNRLTRQQMMRIHPLLPSPTGEVDSDGEPLISEQTMEEQMSMVDVILEELEKNITSVSGLKDADGNALKVADTINEAYFTQFYSNIGNDLISESIVKGEEDGDDEKKQED